ncbi:MAG: bifunctional metallophosphatase/5'-nucleotidase [Chlorobi bacterium]|nr:bifunctional metallophosphatase/5'-nucleotidase [Chlorobiota bacterium]
MKKLIIIPFVFIFFSVFAQNDTTEIIILHTNDMHSKIDNFDKLKTVVDTYKSKYKNVYLFSAGDLFTGNPVVDQYKYPGYPMIQLMNKMPYDLSCFGNHEFDYGQATLNKRIKQAKFPFICANIETEPHAVLKQPDAYYKFTAKDGTVIGILGLLQVGKNGFPASSPLKMKNIIFHNPLSYVEKYKSYKDSSDIFICLSHLGYEDDIKLADNFPYFDVIIGGHSHTVLKKGVHKNNTFILQAGSYLKYCGVLNLKLVNHKIVYEKDSLINLYKQDKDPEISKIIKAYDNNPGLNIVIGTAAKSLMGKNELGSMMTDAMRDTLKVDIAFQNNGGIRIHEIPKGNIIVKQVFELSPFGNTFVTYKMCPVKIKKLIKYAYSIHNQPTLQVSGITIEMKIENKKLKKIILKDKNGKKLPFKFYTVAINDYMANAYTLKFLKNGKNTGLLDADVTENYIKKHSPLNYKGVKRIFVNEVKK